MSLCRRVLVLVSLTTVIGAALPALSMAQGGPCSPSTPQYCPPPKVKTGPAKGVTAVSATLTGTVNPNGSATSCSFEYGKNRSYGSSTRTRDVGSRNKNVKVSAKVTGLTPKTTYHYQLVCKNLGGRAGGGDRNFKTHGLPHKHPRVTTERSKHKTSTSATFLGTVDPHGSATTCRFQYGLTTSYGSKTRVQQVGSGTTTKNVTAHVGGLAPKTVYHYRLFCHNAGGQNKGRDRRVETLNRIKFRGRRTIHVSSTGVFFVRLHCDGNAHCVGFLTLTGKGGKRLAGRVRYVVPAHTTKRIKVRLTPGALARLSSNHHLRGRLHARNLDGSKRNRRVTLRQG